MLIRTDSVGNEKWHKTFGYPEIDTPINISKATDGNYFIAGQMEFNNFSKAAIYKIDTSGNIKWYNHYAITEQTEFWKATELGDGSIIAAGLAEDTSDYIGKGLLMKVDALGNPLWHRIFPVGNNHAWFRNVYPTADGGFIMPGSAVDGPSGNQDAWLVKVDSLGCDSNGCALYTALPSIAPLSNGEGPEVRIFPNPCSHFFLINFTKKQNDYDTYTVTVTNSAGQILLKQKMVNSTQPHPIFVQSLTAGFYMVKVSVGDNVYVRKLIIEK
nr:T9SS type A sorting domain-containing protein [Bacteroidota bacterium]